uniref:Putative secreted protein n=1 Tax=Amblyomma triste TaxID=251400 RepID=A0A023G231_AMBTT
MTRRLRTLRRAARRICVLSAFNSWSHAFIVTCHGHVTTYIFHAAAIIRGACPEAIRKSGSAVECFVWFKERVRSRPKPCQERSNLFERNIFGARWLMLISFSPSASDKISTLCTRTPKRKHVVKAVFFFWEP